MFIKIGKVLKRDRDLTYLIYTLMIDTQCIYYIILQRHSHAESLLSRLARSVDFFPIWHGFKSYTNYNVVQVGTIAFMFQISYFCKSFLFFIWFY